MSNDLEQINKISELAISKGLNPGMLQDCAEKFGPGSPPVLGCLLALVREAWADPGVSCGPYYAHDGQVAGWSVAQYLNRSGGFDEIGCGATEAEALADTLEAAP